MDNLDQDLGGLPILKKSEDKTSDLGGLPILKKKVGTSESLPSESPSQSQKGISEALSLVESLKKNPSLGVAKNLPKEKVVYADKNIPSATNLIVPTNLPKQDVIAYESELRTNDAAINTLKDIYNKKGLKFDPSKPAAKAQIQEYVDKEKNNDLVRVQGKDGKEYLTRGAGFWETAARSFAKSLYDPIESTEVNTTFDANKLADLLDEKINNESNYPEQVPAKFSGYYGGLAGGLPKMYTLLKIPYVGEAALVTDMYNNAMASQKMELYQRGLQQGLDRYDAAKMARENAPKTAIPEAIMGLVLARAGGGTVGRLAEETALGAGKQILPNAAKKSFVDAVNTFGKETAGMAALGASSEVGKGLLQRQSGYNITNEELINNGLSGAKEWGLMHAAFKLANTAPKAVSAAAKNLLSYVPEPILKVEAESHPDGQKTLEEVQLFADAKAKVPDFVPEEKVASVTGLTQKIDNLKKDVLGLEEKKKGLSPSLVEQIDVQIEDKNKEINFYDNQIKKVIESKSETGIDEEIDDVTGKKIGQITEPIALEKKPIEEIKPTDISNKSIEELEKRQAEIENAKSGTPENKEYNDIDKELQNREWRSVFDTPLDKVSSVVDDIMKKEKEMPNGYGSYMEPFDARLTKEISNKYSKDNISNLTDKDIIKDFKDAMFGKPMNLYSDGLKLRESINEARKRGLDVFDELSKEFIKDGYSKQDAINMAKRKLEPLLKSIEPIVKPKAELEIYREVKPAEVKTEVKPKDIFPKTMVENVLYHDSDIDNLTEFKNSDNGIFATGDENWWQKGKNKYAVAVDIKNPKIVSTPLSSIMTKEFFSNPENNQYDAIITTGTSGDMSKAVYAVRDASQIKVLGKNVDGKIVKSEVKPTEVKREVEPVKPFKSSQGHSVELENGKLIVKNKKEEVLSGRASKKSIEEYADNFDYTKGKKAPEVPNEIVDPKQASQFVIEESNNPAEIAQIYASEIKLPSEGNPKFQAIAEYGLGRVTTDSYKRFGDVNKMEPMTKLRYLNKKGFTIDQRAEEISGKTGLDITPQDIVDYIEKYSKGDYKAMAEEETNVALQAKDKFKKLTGLDLNTDLANKILDKELEKANQNQLDIIKEDYETAKQLEDAYWAEYEKTDGFTKESPVSKVNEPKATKEEKVTEEEEPETTSIKNKVTAEERAKKGLEEIEVTAKRTFGDVFEKGKKLVDEGKIDARQMAKDLVNKPKALSPEESVALLYDRMKIQNEYKKLSADIENESDGIVKDLMISKLKQLEQDALINDEASRKTGYEQGLGLAVRKMIIKEDYSLLNQLNKYKLANNGEELTPEVRKKLEENVLKLEEAQKKLEEYEQKVKDLEAKKTIDNEVKKTKKLNKTNDDFKKEREDIFKNIKDKWDRASKGEGGLTAVPVPYAAQLAAISPEVLKLVKSYAEQGITKLDDIVDDLHKNISKSIPEISKRDVKDILAGEYVKKKESLPVDREKMKLESNVNRIKNQIQLERLEIERSKRSPLRKGIDYFQAWRRAALLSGVPVLGKISLGAGIRSAITTPVESIISKGLSVVPGLSKIAKGAPREGTFNPKAEAKAFAQFVDKATYEDVRRVLKTGRGELEELHDKKLYPSNGWLDFFGNLHAAIKVIPKRAEYFRALEYRTENALKNGADLADPLVQQEISAGAYADALRSIYMQENYVTELYKNSIRFLETAKGGTGKPIAEVLKFMLPIVKVPTNYVAEQSSYILGGVKALYALRKGISKLSAEEKDYVMRALKKQSIGAAFLMLGYANPQAVGGYYTGKRKKGDLEAGDLVVFGVHMPHWALHTPLLEALQFGASIRRARDEAGKSYRKKDLNMFTGVVPAGAAVLKQVPFTQQAEQITRIKNMDAFLKYAGGQAQSVIDPQLIKNIAEFTDYSNGQWNKREAKTFEEKLKAGFPGTRQELKIKKE